MSSKCASVWRSNDLSRMAALVKKSRKKIFQIDYIGLGLVSVGLGSLEVIYAKVDPRGRVATPFGTVGSSDAIEGRVRVQRDF